MRRSMPMRAILLTLAASVPPAGAEPSPAPLASGRVGAAVRSALATETRTRVVVYFRVATGAAAVTPPGRRVLATRCAAVLAAAGSEFTLRRRFAAISAVAGDVSTEGVRRLLEQADVLRIDLDAPGSAHLLESLPLAAVAAVKALGFRGANVSVAIIDSGLDRDHPAFTGDLVDEACFCSGGTGCCPGGGATQLGAGAAEDNNGHGTNVTGIVTSNGGVAPEGGAPGARIVAVRVLDAAGRFCCSSDILAALDWVLDSHPEVRVVNASLGTDALYGSTCDAADATTMAFAQAIDALRANGTLTFVSSGNQGSTSQIAAPACVASAMAVGAVWDASLGSRTFLGCTDVATAADLPTCFTNSSAAVDLFAPGAFVTATGIGGGTSTYGGTSQASPIAAACAADLISADPAVTADALEAALESSPVAVTDPKNGRVFPRLDCAASLDALGVSTTTVTSTTTSTTTTLACSAGATFPSIGCRLDALVATVEAASDLDGLATGLGNLARKARDKADQGEALAADLPRSQRALRAAIVKLRTFQETLRSRTARRRIPGGTRAALLGLGGPILTDMKTLKRSR